MLKEFQFSKIPHLDNKPEEAFGYPCYCARVSAYGPFLAFGQMITVYHAPSSHVPSTFKIEQEFELQIQHIEHTNSPFIV